MHFMWRGWELCGFLASVRPEPLGGGLAALEPLCDALAARRVPPLGRPWRPGRPEQPKPK